MEYKVNPRESLYSGVAAAASFCFTQTGRHCGRLPVQSSGVWQNLDDVTIPPLTHLLKHLLDEGQSESDLHVGIDVGLFVVVGR